MLEVFGTITPFLLISIVTGATEFIKRNWSLEGRVIQLVALGLSVLLIAPYHIIGAGEISPASVYEAVVYSAISWMTSIGLYEAGATWLAKRQQ